MQYIFASPSLDDLLRVLHAWRFWVLGAIVGALIGAVIYFIVPPPYRARAIVNVDFNLEQAWPQETDRQQFYYLERETRKLEEIAWSDEVLNQVSSQFGIPVEELRAGKLQLSQPAEAGWHFYGDDPDPQFAASLASAWAKAFVVKADEEVASGAVNQFVKLELTQSANLSAQRRVPLSGYLLAGSAGFLTLAVFIVLFIRPRK